MEISVQFLGADYTGETIIETYSDIELHTCTDLELDQFYKIKDSD